MNYTNFAKVYDLLMEDVPYETWVNNIEKLWEKHNLKPKLVADLGCGTGVITTKLNEKGYDMIGIDNSFDMLTVAKSKSDVLYLCQDMREFELYGSVDSIISTCDSVNYILEEKDLLKVFKLVEYYLNPNGIFIFDINTKYKFEKILGDNTFAYNLEQASYIWENYFDEETNINEYVTTFFIENENGLYEKHEEIHYEKAYSIDTLKTLIKQSNLKLLEVLDEDLNKPKENSSRLYFVCKKEQ